MATTTTKSEYAKLRGVSPAAISQAIKSGRVVVLPDGRVDVDASNMLWDARTDPAQSARANASKQAAAAPTESASETLRQYNEAKAKREQHLAAQEELNLRRAQGLLCETAKVAKVLTDVMVTFRSAIERVPDKLAERLAAESDAVAVHALLTAELAASLSALSQDCAATATDLQAGVDDGR